MKIEIKKLNDNFSYDFKNNNQTITIDKVLEGEMVDVVLNKNKAIVKQIIKAHPERVKVMCPIYDKCGGCKLLHAKYSYQLALKTEMVKRLFQENKYKCTVLDTIGMDKPYNYRNKNQIVFGFDSKRKIVSGFYEENTHQIINFDKCLVQDEYADKVVNTIRDLMSKMRLMPYDEDRKIGLIRHVMIKRSRKLDQTMVVIVTSTEVFPGRSNFLKALISACPKITTVIQNINPKKTTQVLGEKEIILYGSGYILDELCGKKFKISSKSFYQINPEQTQKLYTLALKSANLQKTDKLLDAYSGIGTIGIIASNEVEKVISVELEKQAVQDAIYNAKINNVKNVHFFNDDATNFIINLANKKEQIDVVVMDPPRKGSTEAFLKALLKLKPKKIIYISCDPHTQVIDLKQLINDYNITYVQPVDMFPHSQHVENIVLLDRKYLS